MNSTKGNSYKILKQKLEDSEIKNRNRFLIPVLIIYLLHPWVDNLQVASKVTPKYNDLPTFGIRAYDQQT